MKRSIYFALVGLFFLATQVAAQGQPAYIGAGFKIGLNVSGAAYYDGQSSTRTGYQAGGLLCLRQTDYFAVQLELLYISKGYKLKNVTITDDEGYTGQADFDIILNYLEMPLMARMTLPLAPKYNLFFLGGGFIGRSVESKARYLQGIPIDLDLGNANKIDAGALAGIGFDAKAGGGRFFLEVRFESSFTPAIKNRDQKLQLVSLSAGYWW